MNILFLPDFTNKATQWNKTSNTETLPHNKNKPCLFKPSKTKILQFLVILTKLSLSNFLTKIFESKFGKSWFKMVKIVRF